MEWFGDEDAGGIVLLKSFDEYYNGYVSVDGEPKPGYVELINDLTTKFPAEESQIIGEQNQKEFIALFGAVLRMRNLLSTFDEFETKGILKSISGFKRGMET